MGSELHENAEDERAGWAISRRRKLAAAIVGVMMLGIVWDGPVDEVPHASSADSASISQVDEFDRIEAMLAAADTPKVAGRGPTVEVPEDLAMNVERPSFDFAAFDQMDAQHTKSLAAGRRAVVESSESSSKPPSPDSPDFKSRQQELQIPNEMALGQMTLSDSPHSHSPHSHSPQNHSPQNRHSSLRDNLPSGGNFLAKEDSATSDPNTGDPNTTVPASTSERKSNPVKIIVSDVTASPVTRFEPVEEKSHSTEAGRIHFTGTIFPVSRSENSDE